MFLSKLARAFRAASAQEPILPQYAMSFGIDGRYELVDDRIIGWVKEERADPRNRLCVLVYRRGALLAWVDAERQLEEGVWRFSVDVAGMLTGRDLLSDQVQVTVVDRTGGSIGLRMEGSAQLNLIRTFVSPQV